MSKKNSAKAEQHKSPLDDEADYSFEALVHKERAFIDGKPEPAANATTTAGGRPEFYVSSPGPADEPWVRFSIRDFFGLALSGGGIRSATFNLGLLQALHEKRILQSVDYVSTVSGGGYAGGFLTAWNYKNTDSTRSFPAQAERASRKEGRPPETREPAPIRHLREYSRFLVPRSGLFRMDTWSAVVTILGGLLPSLAAALALLATGIYAWVLLTWGLSAASPESGALEIGALTLLALLLGDYKRGRRYAKDKRSGLSMKPLACVTALAVGMLWLIVGSQLRAPTKISPITRWLGERVPISNSVGDPVYHGLHDACVWLKTHFNFWSTDWLVPNWFAREPHPAFDASVGGAFAAPAGWLAIVILLFFIRVLVARFPTADVGWSAAIDRVIAVCLSLALVWTLLGLLWIGCQRLLVSDSTTPAAAGIGAGAVASGGIFAWLRDWLGKTKEETNASGLLQRLQVFFKPVLPQVLAFVAVALMAALVCLIVQASMAADFLRGGLAIIAVIHLATLLIFDPSRVGMHDFYRSRICRCFLGAAEADDSHPRRDTVEQADDEIEFGELREAGHKPGSAESSPTKRQLHLVCCTANNLSGDTLGNLYRGCRSAVLSPHGVALGNCAGALNEERLSSALTASAAAFNSQMGRLSMNFGPAVAFLMSAMNLRLGL